MFSNAAKIELATALLEEDMFSNSQEYIDFINDPTSEKSVDLMARYIIKISGIEEKKNDEH